MSTVGFRVLKREFGYILASLSRYYLKVFDHSRNNFVFQTTVLSLSVLTDSHQIHSFVWSLHSLDRFARSHVCKKIEPLSQCDVEGAVPFSDGGFEGPLESVLVLTDCFNRLVRDEIAELCDPFGVDHVMFELDGYLERVEDGLNAKGYLWAYSVAWEEDNLLFVGGKGVAIRCLPQNSLHNHAVV